MTPHQKPAGQPDAPLRDRSVPTGDEDVDEGKLRTKVRPRQPEAPEVHPDVAAEQDRQQRDTEGDG